MRTLATKWIRALFQPFVVWLLKKPLYKNGVTYYIPSSSLINSKIKDNVRLYEPYKLSNVEIGEYTYISKNSEISYTEIGKFCSIGPNLFCGWGEHPIESISTSPMFYSTKKQNGYSLSQEDKIEERRKISIGNDVFIGANVTILDGVSVGDGAVIGAGSVVSKDIPPYSVAYGVPIKVIRKRFKDDVIEKLQHLEWWNKPELFLEIEKLFFQIDLFLEKYKNG